MDRLDHDAPARRQPLAGRPERADDVLAEQGEVEDGHVERAAQALGRGGGGLVVQDAERAAGVHRRRHERRARVDALGRHADGRQRAHEPPLPAAHVEDAPAGREPAHHGLDDGRVGARAPARDGPLAHGLGPGLRVLGPRVRQASLGIAHQMAGSAGTFGLAFRSWKGYG